MREEAFSPAEVELDVRHFLRSLLKKLPYILVFVVFVTAAVYVFLGTMTPQFSSETTVLIEARETGLTRPTQAPDDRASAVLDEAAIASQVQLILSRDLAARVVEKLDLTSRKEFDPAASPGLIDTVMARLGFAGSEPDDDRRDDRVLNAFAKRLGVFAIEGSRVISIAFRSSDPRLAADIANAVAAEYLTLQAQAKRERSSEAVAFLSGEIEDLSAQVQAAEGRVESFRSENDLFSSGGANPSTLPQQELASLNAELARVRAQRADAQARTQQIQAGIDGGATINQTEVLASPLIQRLVEQQVALRTEIAQLSATLLPQHPRMLELEAQIIDLDRQVAVEAGKILASLEAQADLARAREVEIAAELGRLKAVTARANDAGVDLRALEREAAAQRDLLDSYLRRYREALAREQTDALPADARVISTASAALEPAFPRKTSMSAMAGAAALILAIALVMLRDLASGRSLRPVAVAALATPGADAKVPDDAEAETDAKNEGDSGARWAADHGVRRMMPGAPTIAPELADRVEDSLGAIVARIKEEGPGRIIVTLVEGSDQAGRPLAAVALARALAKNDRRAVVVDLREDDANTETMGERPGLPGLADLVSGEASFAQAIFRDRKSRAHFVPSGTNRLSADSVRDGKLDTVLSALSMTYDLVILDAGDAMIEALAPGCRTAVVVSEHAASDARTVKAFERISGVSEAQILLLVVEPESADKPPTSKRSAGEVA